MRRKDGCCERIRGAGACGRCFHRSASWELGLGDEGVLIICQSLGTKGPGVILPATMFKNRGGLRPPLVTAKMPVQKSGILEQDNKSGCIFGYGPGESQEPRVKTNPLKARRSKSLLNPPTHGIFRENERSPHPRHPAIYGLSPQNGWIADWYNHLFGR